MEVYSSSPQEVSPSQGATKYRQVLSDIISTKFDKLKESYEDYTTSRVIEDVIGLYIEETSLIVKVWVKLIKISNFEQKLNKICTTKCHNHNQNYDASIDDDEAKEASSYLNSEDEFSRPLQKKNTGKGVKGMSLLAPKNDMTLDAPIANHKQSRLKKLNDSLNQTLSDLKLYSSAVAKPTPGTKDLIQTTKPQVISYAEYKKRLYDKRQRSSSSVYSNGVYKEYAQIVGGNPFYCNTEDAYNSYL